MTEAANHARYSQLRAGVVAAMAFSLLSVAAADTSPTSSAAKTAVDSTTVVAQKDRATIEREVGTFVNTIAVKPGSESLARWQPQILLCPLVAGMSKNDGEYILSRVSKIATTAGAPLAPEHCKGNFYIVLTADPEGVLKAWSKRDVRMFGDEADQGGAAIREFNAANPVRVWYNTDGKAPLGLTAWDESFLKAVYTTRITDKYQIAAIKTAMVQDVAP